MIQYPILLAHGLGGFEAMQYDVWQSMSLRIEYFHGVEAHYKSLGVEQVYAPGVPSTGSIAERAEALKRFIDANIDAPKIHIIAHSMGGLDARHYISRLGGAERVASLTTLGTPHHGSAIANLTLDMIAGPLLDALLKIKLSNWRVYVDAYFAGHRDLMPERMERFNAETSDAPTVRYFSYAGEPSAREVHWVLLPFYEYLKRKGEQPGPNDGLVLVESARWSGWRGTVPLDHIGLVNWLFMPTAAACALKPLDFYAQLLQNLSEVENQTDRRIEP
ncbi:alpha/beta fold hydrolase [Candidatus Sumerlaeota bacterium]|nr:alpha/beta fold hydrolase [Candidatus Sumerlaeota bacterium]